MSIIPFQIEPKVGVQLLDNEISRAVPSTRYEFVDVIFNSTADTDTDIRHSLGSTAIDYQVVGWKFLTTPSTVPFAYRYIAGDARPWGRNYIILRCNVAAAQATLLLTTRRD